MTERTNNHLWKDRLGSPSIRTVSIAGVLTALGIGVAGAYVAERKLGHGAHFRDVTGRYTNFAELLCSTREDETDAVQLMRSITAAAVVHKSVFIHDLPGLIGVKHHHFNDAVSAATAALSTGDYAILTVEPTQKGDKVKPTPDFMAKLETNAQLQEVLALDMATFQQS